MTNKQTIRSRWLVTAAAISLAGFVAGAVSAAEVQTSATQSGMKAYKDSRTGKLRQPTPDERAAEGRQTAAKAAAGLAPSATLEVVTYPNGTQRASDSSGAFQESVVATRNADGSLVYSFVTPGHESDVSTSPVPASEAEVQ